MKIISIIGVCTIIAYIVLTLFIALEILQSRLASSRKCSTSAYHDSLLKKAESVKEMLVAPKIMEMPPRNEIACFVMTSVERRNARSVIRRSWGKTIKPLFVLSATGDNSTMDFVMNEAKVFDDLIVIRSEDDNLKLAVAFRYFVKHFGSSKYFMKTNDDALVNPPRLYEFLNDEMTPVDAVIGNVKRFPGRGGIIDWIMATKMRTRYDIEYVEDKAFLIPGFMVEDISEFSAELFSTMPNEVFVTGYIPRLLNYTHFDSSMWISNRSFFSHNHSIRRRAITTGLLPEEIIQFWYQLRNQQNHPSKS